jgi:hypothetical protein
MTTNPFDYVKAINETKVKFYDYDGYNPFLTNKSLSYFPDTIQLANFMNMNHGIDKELQFQFLLNTVRKQKRFSGKWPKHEVSELITLLCSVYKMSPSKAYQAVESLSDEQKEEIKTKIVQGG